METLLLRREGGQLDGCWWVGKRSILLSSKFVSEVLLCLGKIELVDQVKFASSTLFELANQKRV